MAGVGFALKKVYQKGTLKGISSAFMHAAFAAAGPWIFTVIAIGFAMVITKDILYAQAFDDFRHVIIYNFAFSLVFSTPVVMIQTRFLADGLYLRDGSDAPGLFLGALLVLFVVQFPIVVCFYLFIVKVSLGVGLAAIVHYVFIVSVWSVSVFVSSLKNYNFISMSFLVGLLGSVLVTKLLVNYGAAGALIGFSVGLGIISGILASRLYIEYPYKLKNILKFLPHFTTFKYLTLAGIASGIANWIDKWVMWAAPEAIRSKNGMITYPDYDSALFLAYLTIIPSMSAFLFLIETDFFDNYLRYYRELQHRATFRNIEENKVDLINCIKKNSVSVLVLQFTCCIAFVTMAPKLFNALNFGFTQITMFRYGVIGASFQMLGAYMLIGLSYFNNLKALFYINLMFAVTNGLFSYISLKMGFAYYGLGYVMASILMFVVSGVVFMKHAEELSYYTFVVGNE